MRVTTQVRMVVEALREEEPLWGYRICQLAELGPGTVYPILVRLEAARWVRGWPEEDPPEYRPARRYLMLTAHGLAKYLAAEARRAQRVHRKERR